MKQIKELIQVESFKDSYIKLCSGRAITEEEKEYLLGCALLLLNKFVKEETNREYFELAYHIVLTYAVMTEDYEPLNDIALNYGFYPIVRFINQNKLLRKVTINQILYDYSLERYRNKNYIERSESLSGQIESQLQFYKTQEKSGNHFMYIGQGFGECKGPYNEDSNMGNVYIDLRTKDDAEIVNLLVVKTKIEQDFLSYQYLRAVSFLHDIKLISDDSYNREIYGTTNSKKIELLKLGITAGLLKIFEENNQIKNIEKDKYGNIQGNMELKRFYMNSDDYTRFEIRKYIKFEQ